MDVEQLLQRARSAIGAPAQRRITVYRPGAGGTDPQAAHPGTVRRVADLLARVPAAEAAAWAGRAQAAGFGALDLLQHVPTCDCSGFVCWALGLSRRSRQPPFSKRGEPGWIHTDTIWADATAPQHTLFAPLHAPEVGAVVVYPKAGSGERFGHVGIVSAVAGGAATRVLHCSAGNFEAFFDAIAETGSEAFDAQPKTRYAWCVSVARD